MTLQVVPTDIVDHLSDEVIAEWGFRRWGACRKPEVDRSLFYPGRGMSANKAKVICQTCPVRVICLARALENREIEGVWGGTSEKERRKLIDRIDAGETVEELVLPSPRFGCGCHFCRSVGRAILERRAAEGAA